MSDSPAATTTNSHLQVPKISPERCTRTGDPPAPPVDLPPKKIPRRQSTRLPSLCHHKGTGLGYVVLNGKFFYLGPWNAPETQSAYNRKVAEWLAAGRQLPVEPDQITVAEVVDRFWSHAMSYYRSPDGELSTEVDNIRLALRPVLKLYADLRAVEFGPLCLRTIRDEMIRSERLTRLNINKRIGRIKMVFKWATSMEMIPGSNFHALQTLVGLKRGRTEAREGKKVAPAPEELIQAVKPHVSRQVWALIRLQLLTGARPGELLVMQPKDVDRSSEVWVYQPDKHKTRNWGHDRFIYIGPQGQQALAPFLLRPPEDYCFSPKEAERERYDRQRRRLRDEITSRFFKDRKPNWKRKINHCYNVDSYRRAITRALAMAYPMPKHLKKKSKENAAQYKARLGEARYEEAVAFRKQYHWHPHQLRHNAATEIRREFGIEAAKIILGHQNVGITEIYAEQDKHKAMKAIAKYG